MQKISEVDADATKKNIFEHDANLLLVQLKLIPLAASGFNNVRVMKNFSILVDIALNLNILNSQRTEFQCY